MASLPLIFIVEKRKREETFAQQTQTHKQKFSEYVELWIRLIKTNISYIKDLSDVETMRVLQRKDVKDLFWTAMGKQWRQTYDGKQWWSKYGRYI